MTTKLVFIVLVSLYVENRQWEINILSEQPRPPPPAWARSAKSD